MRHWHCSYPKLETHNRMWKGNDKQQAEQGIQQAGKQVTAASQMTGPESTQYQGSFDIGNLLKQIMMYQQGLGQAPTGYQTGEQQYQAQGPLSQGYYQQTLQGMQNPYQAYESQLQPSLQLASDQINRGAQQRGLLRSGIPIEQMGRAGVDLSIREAQDRMNFRNQELARGGQLSQYTQGLQQTNLANLGNLYGQQQSAGLQASGRAATGAANAAQYQAYPYQASLANAYGQQGQLGAGIGGALGTLGGYAVGAALAPATGGMSMMAPLMGAAVGGGAGANLGRSFF